MKELQHYSGEHSAAHDLAKVLGWFSIALGLAELAGPKTIRKGTGAGPKSLLRLFGLREIGAGLLILTARKPVDMVWGRVAGDALDLVALLPTLGRRNRHRLGGAAAFAFVVAATAIDVCVAMQGNKPSHPSTKSAATTVRDSADGALAEEHPATETLPPAATNATDSQSGESPTDAIRPSGT